MNSFSSQVITPTILLIGRTGAGKTSLIRAICGKKKVPLEMIGHGRPQTQDFIEYCGTSMRFWDSKGFEDGQTTDRYLAEINGFIRKKSEAENPEEHIHVVWHFVQAPGARICNADQKIAREIESDMVLVFSKEDLSRGAQVDEMLKVAHESGFDRSCIVAVSEKEKLSIDKLIQTTERLLPHALIRAKERHVSCILEENDFLSMSYLDSLFEAEMSMRDRLIRGSAKMAEIYEEEVSGVIDIALHCRDRFRDSEPDGIWETIQSWWSYDPRESAEYKLLETLNCALRRRLRARYLDEKIEKIDLLFEAD